MIRALIFDYFGVIRPADHGVLATYRKLGGNTQADASFVEDIKAAANYGLVRDSDRQIADKLGVSLRVWLDALGDFGNNDQDLLDYIAQLHTQGYKTGVLSNSGANMTAVYFDPKTLKRYFDTVLLSGDVGLYKPEPPFYRLIADNLGVKPEECVMIDDREEFCEGALRIGMKAILYKHLNQFQAELQELIAKTGGS